ncbi:MAG: hypothetical protein GY737_14660 [Desulfobacteraceae bacterium]|nr:hypothetical protein [Desulfobacteraceae bacterium]
MGKITELLINVVKVKQAKEADKLEPKRYPDKTGNFQLSLRDCRSGGE